jgi:phage terminase Nu1 subunit (DNA packaging protein)
MSDQEPKFAKYPLLEALLSERGLSLKGAYTNRDVGNIFGVSVRTIQDWSRNGYFKPRNLPGRARFLSADLEKFLQDSSKCHDTAPDDSQNLRYIARDRSQPRRAAK